MEVERGSTEVAYARIDSPFPVAIEGLSLDAPDTYICGRDVDSNTEFCVKRVSLVDVLIESIKHVASGRRLAAIESDDGIEILLCKDIDDQYNLVYFAVSKTYGTAVKVLMKVGEGRWRDSCGYTEE